jgi:serine/threonine protein kinase
MTRPMRRIEGARVLDGKYELRELVEYMGDRDHTSLWRGVVHGAAAFVRDVAIRRVPSAISARQAALRGAALEHANVVRVYDVCRDENGYLYLVMEWIDGVSLGEMARGAHHLGLRVPWPLIGCIGVGALHGLAAGHARLDAWHQVDPAIHGHISERSLLVDRRGVVHLTPFGMAPTEPIVPLTVADDLRDLASALWEALASAPSLVGDVDARPSPVRDVLASALDGEYDTADAMARDLAAALQKVPWSRGPQADTGAAVREVANALAWSPIEPYQTDALAGGHVVLVHLAPTALAEARRVAGDSPWDLTDVTGEYEPYDAYEVRP